MAILPEGDITLHAVKDDRVIATKGFREQVSCELNDVISRISVTTANVRAKPGVDACPLWKIPIADPVGNPGQDERDSAMMPNGIPG